MNPVKKMIQELTKEMPVEKVLEIGTGRGDFLEVMVASFDEKVQITGIDTVESYLKSARDNFTSKNVSLIEMNAEKLKFEDHYFDMVFISNTLHHLPKVERVIREMKRVIKPEGLIVIHEMINDNQTPKQNVHVWLHHFCAEIDTYLGNFHGLTYRKSEIKALISELGLSVKEELEYTIENEASEKEIIDSVVTALNQRILKIDDDEIRAEFKQRLDSKVDQIYEVGYTNATEYLTVSGLK